MKRILFLVLVCFFISIPAFAETDTQFYRKDYEDNTAVSGFSLNNGGTAEFESLPADGEEIPEIGDGWKVYRSDAESTAGLYGFVNNSTLLKGTEGKSFYLSTSLPLENDGVRYGMEKELENPFDEGVVNLNARFFVYKSLGTSTTQKEYGIATALLTRIEAFNSEDTSLVSMHLDSSRNWVLSIGGVSQAITGESYRGVTGVFYDYNVRMDLDAKTVEVEIHWKDAAKTSANSLYGFGLNQNYDLIFDDSGNAVLKTKTPVAFSGEANVAKVRYSIEQASKSSLRRSFLDFIEVHNVDTKAKKITALYADGGEAEWKSGSKLSVLTNKLRFEFANALTLDGAALTKDGGEPVSCEYSASVGENGNYLVEVTLPELATDTKYTLELKNAVDLYGFAVDGYYELETGGNPLRFGTASWSVQDDTASCSLQIASDYQKKDAVLLAACYSAEGVAKKFSIVPVTLLQGDNSVTCSVDISDKESGDYMMLMLWDSIEAESGLHPLVLYDDCLVYSIPAN